MESPPSFHDINFADMHGWQTPIHAMASQLIFNSLPGLQHWSEDFSDVKIYCGTEEFKLHSAVLSANSEFFAKALCGQFAESKTGEIRLPEDDKEIFGRLVQFCYSGTYTENLPALEKANETQGKDILETSSKSAQSCFSASYSQHSANSKGTNNRGGFGAVYLSPLEITNNYLYLSGLLGAAGPPMGEANPEPRDASNDKADNETLLPCKSSASCFQSIILAGKVYIMAEALLVPGAKILALERIRAGVDDLVTTSSVVAIGSEFAELIEDVYTKLPDTDIAIKEPICYFFAMKRLDSLACLLVHRLMHRHGALAAGVLHYINLLAPKTFVKGNTVCSSDHFSGEKVVKFKVDIMIRRTEQMRLEWLQKERSNLANA